MIAPFFAHGGFGIIAIFLALEVTEWALAGWSILQRIKRGRSEFRLMLGAFAGFFAMFFSAGLSALTWSGLDLLNPWFYVMTGSTLIGPLGILLCIRSLEAQKSLSRRRNPPRDACERSVIHPSQKCPPSRPLSVCRNLRSQSCAIAHLSG